MKRLFGLALILALSVGAIADDKDAAKELKALEGKWKAVSMESGGKPLPKDKLPEFTFIVGENGKSTAKTKDTEDAATITVDPKKDPRTIDNKNEGGKSKGKMQYGIYKLDGDKWTVCMSRPGVEEKDRPKSFDTKDTMNVTFVFERVKEDKK